MRYRPLLLAAVVLLLLVLAGTLGWLGTDADAPPPPTPQARTSPPDASSAPSASRTHDLPGCPIRMELSEDFENTSPEDRRGAAPAAQYSFASTERPFQLSVTCRIASHNVEDEPARFLDKVTKRMERMLPGGTPERSRISAGPVPGWRFVTRQGDRLIVGNVLARGVRIVLIQIVGSASDEEAIDAFGQRLLTDDIEWTIE